MPTSPQPQPHTRWLLLGGALAGPFFTLVWLMTGASRPDYSALRHPISSLAIGPSGWTQAANFFVTALLLLAFGAGLRRTAAVWTGTRWGCTWSSSWQPVCSGRASSSPTR